MSQIWDVDLIVPNTTHPDTDIQRIIDAFNTLRSFWSGASEPATADLVAYMFWADTTSGLLKIRNAANTAWVTIGPVSLARFGSQDKSTVASATTPDIWTATGDLIDYTGTVTATGFAAAPQAGAWRKLICAGAAPFTAGANMLLNGIASGATYTAAAGDVIFVFAVTTTQFRLTIQKADGTAAGFKIKTAVALADADATLTAVQLVDSAIFTITPTVARILTTDTAVAIIAAIPNYKVGSWLDFTVVNLAAFDVTLAAGVGITLSGKMIVNNASATWKVRIDSATTITIYNTAASSGAAAALSAKAAHVTYDSSTTGAFAIVGAGFTPKAVFIVASNVNAVHNIAFGMMGGSPADQVSATDSNDISANTWNLPQAIVTHSADGTTATLTFTSFDVDGMTLTKTKNGLPTGIVTVDLLFFK